MDPDNWPSPPASAMVFEDPWVLAIALLVIAAGLFFFSGRRHLQRLAAIPVTLAVLVVVAAFTVQTDREQMIAGTYGMVNTLETPGDVGAFADYLAETITFEARGRTVDRDKAAIVGIGERTLSRYAPPSHTITDIKVEQLGPSEGVTYMAVISNLAGDAYDGYVKTKWLLYWRIDDDGNWRIDRIVWRSLNDKPANPRLVP